MAPIIRTCSALASALALLAATPAAADAGDLAAYLRARVAEQAGQGRESVAAYARALADAPANPVIAIRAYREGVAAGDAALVRQAAGALAAAEVAPDDAALWPLVDAARAADPAAVERALPAIAAGRLRILLPALHAWIATARGQDGLAIEAPKDDAVARRLLNETRALLLIGTGHVAEGIAAARALGGTAPSGAQLAAAELLIGGGHDEAAATLLGHRPGQLAAARAGATARPTLAFGVSRLLLRLADDLGGDRASNLGLSFARAALDADPGYARARLTLAEQLVLADDPDLALAQLALVPADGPLGATAAGRRINLLDAEDRAADALAAARVRAEARDAVAVDRARYADLLVAADRPADALPFYAALSRDADASKNWATWLRYGAALDQAGRWKEARRVLRRAVALGPQEASALNYLGYAMIEHGEDLPDATRLLERANALAADDASIADSLGWAYHRIGQTPRGLPLLERAAADAPANAEIAEHLGDAYWSLGRRYEARYAWAAAAVTAEHPATARLAAKQESGL